MYCSGRSIIPLTRRTIAVSIRCLASDAVGTHFTEQKRVLNFLEQRKQVVACNIHLNSGGDESHPSVLSKLILRAQEYFSKREPKPLPHPLPADDFEQSGKYKTIDLTCVGALVEAHMDPLSNRSSLHLAGPVEHLVEIVNELILMAVTEFRKRKRGCKLLPEAASQKALSKVIDIIDHVTFLPLVPGKNGYITATKKWYSPAWVPNYAAWAARQVGNFMHETAKIQVFYHDFAHRRNVPLSTVTNERLMRYRGNKNLPESAYVGAYLDFVENFHIILSSPCGKARAWSLAEVLSNKECGVIDVKAYVDQYDKDHWEVKCRLMQPHIVGSNVGEVQFATQKWLKMQPENEEYKKHWIVKSYRVGSSYDQCLKLLEEICESESRRQEHDAAVIHSFEKCCTEHYPVVPPASEDVQVNW